MADPKTGQLAHPEDFATPSEGGTTPAPQPQGYVKTPRDIAIEEMAKRAQQRRLQSDSTFKVDTLNEDGSISAAPETAPAEPVAPEPATEPETGEVEQVAAAEAEQKTTKDSIEQSVPLAAAPEEERELIVDGKRIRVPLSKILDAGTRTIQKETTADMRLAAATELLRSAQERQAAPAPAPTPAQATPSDEDALLARQIQFGTEDEAKAAIAKLRNATPTITPQQIAALVQQSLAQTLPEHAAFNEANAWLRAEHKQIVDDPDLKFLFDTKEEQARKAGDRRPYKELYAAIAGEITTKFNLAKPAPVQNVETTPLASDRITRKANAPRPITGASGRVEQPRAAPRPQTVTEYVQRQRQLRGLQPLNNQGI